MSAVPVYASAHILDGAHPQFDDVNVLDVIGYEVVVTETMFDEIAGISSHWRTTGHIRTH